MAIAYKSAGAGASTETSGAACSPASPATVDAGDILIIHAYFEGTATAPSTPSGFTLLHGPEVIQSTIGRHWIFGKIAAGTEGGAANALGTQAVTTMRSGRCYSFSGRVSGTITDLVLGFAATSNATDPQMPSVTTTVTGAIAAACVAQNDNNTAGDATGESGGDWTEAVAEYVAALTPGLMLQLQTAAMASPGTISGGSVATANDPCGVIGFEIRPSAPAAPVLLGGEATGAGSATGALQVAHLLGGAASGAGAATGAIQVSRLLGGTAAGAGDATGLLDVGAAVELGGEATGAGTAAGGLQVTRLLGAGAAGAGSADGALEVTRILSGAASGAGNAAGGIQVTRMLSGAAAGAGAATGSLAVGGPVLLSGAATGLGAATASVQVARLLVGMMTGGGAGAAALRVERLLRGMATGIGLASGRFDGLLYRSKAKHRRRSRYIRHAEWEAEDKWDWPGRDD